MEMTFYHNMKLCHTSSCQVSELGEKVKLHDDHELLHVGCYSSPPPTQDLVPRSKSRTRLDTLNGDDLRAPKWPPCRSDETTEPS